MRRDQAIVVTLTKDFFVGYAKCKIYHSTNKITEKVQGFEKMGFKFCNEVYECISVANSNNKNVVFSKKEFEEKFADRIQDNIKELLK